MVRRGLEDGTERLRLQFRDAAQRGQRDEYGGDKIEDTAASGARQMDRGVRNLLKNKKVRTASRRTSAGGGRIFFQCDRVWPSADQDAGIQALPCRPGGRERPRPGGGKPQRGGSGLTPGTHICQD